MSSRVELMKFVKDNFKDVKTYGVVNPSIIIIIDGVSFLIYEANKKSGTNYVLCQGIDRWDIPDLKKIHGIIKKHIVKINKNKLK